VRERRYGHLTDGNLGSRSAAAMGMAGRGVRRGEVIATERQAIASLRRAGSARRAAGMRGYFKRDEVVAFFGAATPAVRRIAGDLARARRGAWDVRAAIAFCDAMLRRPELEAKSVGLLVLGRWRRSYPRSLARTARAWLAAERCATWAIVDLLAPEVLQPLVEQFPDLAPTIARWTSARSLWVRRAAAVTFVPFARHGRHLELAYGVADRLLGDELDLIHKATGWLLREAGKTDSRRLERFLRARGPRLPRTALRYAIERFPPDRRVALLHATR
jgi:3-methyladenine DNA glycosylase AlkD